MARSSVTSDPGSAPPGPPPRKRWHRWLAGGLLVVAVAAAGLAYWRAPVAGAVLRAGLEAAGFANPRLTVTDLSLSRIRLTGIRLGDDIDVVSADVEFDLLHRPGPVVTHLSLGRTRLDLTDPAGPLRQRLDAEDGATAPITLRRLLAGAADWPRITIGDLKLRYPVGGGSVMLGGSLATARPAARTYAARYALTLSGHAGQTLAIEGTARLGLEEASMEARLTDKEAVASGTLSGRADLSASDARVVGRLQLTVANAERLAERFPLARGISGRLSLAARAVDPLVIGLDAPLDPASLAAALTRAGARGVAIEATLERGAYKTGTVDLAGVDATVSAVVRAADVSPDGLRLEGTFGVRADRVAAADLHLNGISLDAPFRADRVGDRVIINLPQRLQGRVSTVQGRAADIALSPVAFSLVGGRTHAVRFNVRPPHRLDLRLGLTLDAVTVRSGTVRRVDVAPLSVRLVGTVDQDGRTRFHLRAPRLSASDRDQALIIDDLAVTALHDDTADTANLRGRVSYRHRGKPVAAPLAVRANLAHHEGVLTFDGRAEAPGAAISVTRGSHNTATGEGRAALVLQPLTFGAAGAAFRTLVPGLPDIDVPAGTVRADARLTWNKDGLDGKASARLEDMSVTHRQGVTLEGLSATFRLDRLSPPRSPPGQTLRIRRLSAGAVLDDLTFRYALIDDATGGAVAVQVDGLSMGFAGGRLSVRPTVLGTAAGTGEATVDVAGMDLADLLALIGLEGVSGTGRLSGFIPLSQSGSAISIKGGRLAATGPGVMRIRSEAAKTALAQGGAEVALMLSALEDFRYETLTLDINKEAGGDGRILLSTRGHNPAVRDGQPFVINLNVSGNVDRLAAVAAQALRLPGALVRTMVPTAP